MEALYDEKWVYLKGLSQSKDIKERQGHGIYTVSGITTNALTAVTKRVQTPRFWF